MIRDEAINQLGFAYVVEWVDGRIETKICYGECHAIEQVERLNRIEGVTAFAYKLTLGDQVA